MYIHIYIYDSTSGQRLASCDCKYEYVDQQLAVSVYPIILRALCVGGYESIDQQLALYVYSST